MKTKEEILMELCGLSDRKFWDKYKETIKIPAETCIDAMEKYHKQFKKNKKV
jgi:hypothetical protein